MVTFYTKDEILDLDRKYFEESTVCSTKDIEDYVQRDWNNRRCYYKTDDEAQLQEDSNFKEIVETTQERKGEKLYHLTEQNNELPRFLKVVSDHWCYEEVIVCYVPNEMKLEIQFAKDGLFRKETFSFNYKNFKQYYLILTAIFPYVAFSSN